MVYFNKNQDYFECHEVLEEYWKSIPGYNKSHPLTAYILLATGMYHWRRQNEEGALKTLRKAAIKFQSFSGQFTAYTEEIGFSQLLSDIRRTIKLAEAGQPFQAFTIQCASSALQGEIDLAEQSMDLLPFDSELLIYKHMLRDRSDILRLREEKKKGRCQ